jgi:hypothetical protein
MQATELKALISALQNGIVNVTFKKIDTEEIRVMESTLKTSILEENGITATVDNVSPESDHVAVWCLDKDAWRSFRVNTVVNWEVV